MKIKQNRDDFVVREQCSLPMTGGRFAVYNLLKSGLGTPEAIEQIITAWKLQRYTIAYAGLKDRHAATEQVITIKDGPQQDLMDRDLQLVYAGQAAREVTAQDIVANRFEATIRELDAAQAQRMREVASSGTLCIPNYFDEQRFGSVGESGEFIAHPWCLANYERALYLAIAEHNQHDRPRDREQKGILRDNWGDWLKCKELLERSSRRSIVTYLVDHPTNFKKAAALLRKDMRSLYVAAFQSKLWNEVLSRHLMRLATTRSMGPAQSEELAEKRVLKLPSVAGTWNFPIGLSTEVVESLQSLLIPLPSGRKSTWPVGFGELLDEVLSEFQMERHKLRFSYPRDVFFARAMRPALLQVRELTTEVEAEAGGTTTGTASGTATLHLSFSLPSGQYATMFFKALELLSTAE